jgi:hypothetical protein
MINTKKANAVQNFTSSFPAGLPLVGRLGATLSSDLMRRNYEQHSLSNFKEKK